MLRKENITYKKIVDAQQFNEFQFTEKTLVSEQHLHELELVLLGELIETFEKQVNDTTFSLLYRDGLTVKEIAEQNNESIRTITNRLVRLRRKFRQLYAEQIKTLHDAG